MFCNTYYRSAFDVARPLIKVVTPRKIANDLLRNLMIEIQSIITNVGRHLYRILSMVLV